METIYVTKPYLPELSEYEKYLERIWESKVLTNKGILYNEFKEKLINLVGNENTNLFCNGHNALECALKSLEMEKGEIITTPFTFVSTTHAIINCGFTPVFCDIKEEDMTIDETKIEEKITDKTVAILPVHVYGYPCNVEAIEKIAQKYKLKVIYDAAHAFGVCKDGQSILNYGDISMVSFHATKLFHTIEGGMTVSRDKKVSEKQELLQNFGILDSENVIMIGGNSKMNEFSAAMGLATIDDLEKIIERRKSITFNYISQLEQIRGIKTFSIIKDGIKPNYAYFPIIVDPIEYEEDRNQLSCRLADNGIIARKYFYPITSDMRCYEKKYPEFKTTDVSIARKMSDRILTLPIYYDLQDKDIDRICKVLRKWNI